MGRSVASDTQTLRHFLSVIDEALIDRVASKMVEAMATAVPEVGANPDVRADTLAASRETAAGFLHALDADPWIAPAMSPALGDLARTIARRGEDITTLIKLTRYGQSEFWPALMDLAEQEVADQSARMRLLNVLFDRFGRYIETQLDSAVVAFQDERDSLIRGANARREETIRALLEGDGVNVDAASKTLGYELRRWHTALELWEPAGGHEALDRLEALARDLAAALGGGRPLTRPSSSRGLYVWVGTDRAPGPDQRALVAAVTIPDSARVAMGRPAIGVPGFRQSHDEAIAAQRVAVAAQSDAQLTEYADVEVASLLSHDPRGARALIARELDGLTGTDAQSAKLRATVLAFLRCGGSATAAARLLDVHTNTVRYRIDQAEGLLERPLAGQQLPLQLAIMLVETLGTGFLPED